MSKEYGEPPKLDPIELVGFPCKNCGMLQHEDTIHYMVLDGPVWKCKKCNEFVWPEYRKKPKKEGD